MNAATRIALIGDYNAAVLAHQAIPRALALAGQSLDMPVEYEWVPTYEISDDSRIAAFDGYWCVPASPYRDMEGALRAIRFAREQRRPFLGTCGGFQHAIIEYARNVVGWADADHAETTPSSARAVITPLACSLVEKSDTIRLCKGSILANAYACLEAVEAYHCNYGVNPSFVSAFTAGPLRRCAEDRAGNLRAVELEGHPFFVATLFQPERAALANKIPPIVVGFLRAIHQSGHA